MDNLPRDGPKADAGDIIAATATKSGVNRTIMMTFSEILLVGRLNETMTRREAEKTNGRDCLAKANWNEP